MTRVGQGTPDVIRFTKGKKNKLRRSTRVWRKVSGCDGFDSTPPRCWRIPGIAPRESTDRRKSASQQVAPISGEMGSTRAVPRIPGAARSFGEIHREQCTSSR